MSDGQGMAGVMFEVEQTQALPTSVTWGVAFAGQVGGEDKLFEKRDVKAGRVRSLLGVPRRYWGDGADPGAKTTRGARDYGRQGGGCRPCV